MLTNKNELNTSENIDPFDNISTDVIDEVNEEIIKKMYNINLEKVRTLQIYLEYLYSQNLFETTSNSNEDTKE